VQVGPERAEDALSTNTKVLALTPEGVVVGQAAGPTPRDVQGLAIDIPALRVGVDRMITQTCGDTYEVHAICAAGIGEDGVLVDAALRPVCPDAVWRCPRVILPTMRYDFLRSHVTSRLRQPPGAGCRGPGP
jgi:hypothetical protein